MGVSLTTVVALRAADHGAIHPRDEGLIRLPDPMIMAKALAEIRIVLTFDLDFGDILATAGSNGPSVIILSTPKSDARRRKPLALSRDRRLRAGTHWRGDHYYRRRGFSPPAATNPAMTPEFSGIPLRFELIEADLAFLIFKKLPAESR